MQLAQLREELENRLSRMRIEVPGRFVRQQQLRLVQQRPRNRRALLFAARKFRRPVTHAAGKPDRFQQRDRTLLRFAARQPRQIARQHDVFEHGQLRQQMVGLEDEADLPVPEPGGLAAAQLRHVDSGDADRPGIRLLQRADQIQQRGFAAAGGAEQAGPFAAPDLPVHAAQDRQFLPAEFVGARDAAQFDDILLFTHSAMPWPGRAGPRRAPGAAPPACRARSRLRQ